MEEKSQAGEVLTQGGINEDRANSLHIKAVCSKTSGYDGNIYQGKKNWL